MVNPQDTVGILTDRMGRMVCTNCGAELDIIDFNLFERIICPSCEHEEIVPGKLGNFLLLDQLGVGGMGAVYLAQDQSLRRRVALKVMRQQYGQNTEFYESFVREAQATAKLNDINVVQIYSFGQEKGQPYIVMELVDGHRLDEMMQGGQRLDELFILQTALGVAAGLSKAHESGIVHGDIKPANILYDKEDRPKVVDFGLAKFMGAGTQSGEIWGTPFYIAPEKIKKKKEDEYSDQYCLGATLWHALAGRPPFDGKTAKEVVLARLDHNAQNLHELDPAISKETARIIARMMMRKPSLRYPTYASLQSDLRKAINHVTARREAASEARKVAAKKKPPNKLKQKLVSLGVVAAATIALSLIFVVLPQMKEKQKARERARILRSTKSSSSTKKPPVKRSSRSDDNPFTRIERKMLAEFGEQYAAGNTLQGDTTLGKLRATNNKYAPEKHVARQWISLVQGLSGILMNQPQLMKDLLLPVKNAEIKYDGETEPTENPRVLAQALLGELNVGALNAKISGAATWYVELAGFINALKLAHAGKANEAMEALAPYADQEKRDPQWAYALQPIAQRLRKEHEDVKALLPKGNSNPDLNKINNFYNTSFPIWKAVFDPYLEKIAATENQEAERLKAERMKAEAAKQQEHEAMMQAERARVNESIAAVNQKAATKHFASALQELDDLSATLQFQESKNALVPAQQRLRRKADTKAFLLNAINTVPYKGAPILRGRPVKAEEDWIGIKLPNRGTKVPWDKLPEVEFAKLGSFYIENASKEPKEQANHAIGMALFFYDHGNRKIAAKFVDKAGAFDPSSQAAIKQFMPEL